jgi:hypothetical protein
VIGSAVRSGCVLHRAGFCYPMTPIGPESTQERRGAHHRSLRTDVEHVVYNEVFPNYALPLVLESLSDWNRTDADPVQACGDGPTARATFVSLCRACMLTPNQFEAFVTLSSDRCRQLHRPGPRSPIGSRIAPRPPAVPALHCYGHLSALHGPQHGAG